MSKNLVKIKNAIPQKAEPTGIYLAEKEREYIATCLQEQGFGDVRGLITRLKALALCSDVGPANPSRADWLEVFETMEDEFLR